MTAEQVFWLCFIFIPLTILWVVVMLDVMKRPDLKGWHKALWLLAIIFFPWIGALGYLITRPSEVALARHLSGGVPATASGAYAAGGGPYAPPAGGYGPRSGPYAPPAGS
jgi:hypothetical protein